MELGGGGLGGKIGRRLGRLARALSGAPPPGEGAVRWFSAGEADVRTGERQVGDAENGAPVTHTLVGLASEDGKIASGLWDSSAGRHVICFDFDEWVHILEGEAHVTIGGETRTLRAGDVAFFHAGVAMTWEVPKYVRKVWVHRYDPHGLVGKTAGRARRAFGASADVQRKL